MLCKFDYTLDNFSLKSGFIIGSIVLLIWSAVAIVNRPLKGKRLTGDLVRYSKVELYALTYQLDLKRCFNREIKKGIRPRDSSHINQ